MIEVIEDMCDLLTTDQAVLILSKYPWLKDLRGGEYGNLIFKLLERKILYQLNGK